METSQIQTLQGNECLLNQLVYYTLIIFIIIFLQFLQPKSNLTELVPLPHLQTNA